MNEQNDIQQLEDIFQIIEYAIPFKDEHKKLLLTYIEQHKPITTNICEKIFSYKKNIAVSYFLIEKIVIPFHIIKHIYNAIDIEETNMQYLLTGNKYKINKKNALTLVDILFNKYFFVYKANYNNIDYIFEHIEYIYNQLNTDDQFDIFKKILDLNGNLFPIDYDMFIYIDKFINKKINNIIENPKIDADILEKYCELKTYVNKNVVKHIIDKKIIPTQQCFNALLSSQTISSETQSELIKLFINAGYIITFPDIVKLIQHGYSMKKIETFCNVDDDTDNEFNRKKIIDEFIKNGDELKIYEYLEPSKQLYILFGHAGHMAEIKKLIKQHNITPDLLHLQNACKHGSHAYIKLLTTKYGIKPDITCFHNIFSAVSCSVGIRTLVLAMFEQHTDE